MAIQEKNTSIDVVKKSQPRHEWGRAWWIAPRPFDLVSSALYIAVLITYYLYGCRCFMNWQHDSMLATAILVLLSIDRVEYWLYRSEPPRRVAALMLILRCVLIYLVALLDRFNFSPFLFLIVPFLGCLYFSNLIGYGLALLAWLEYFSHGTFEYPDWFNREIFVNNLIIFTLGLLFAIMMARTVMQEKLSRARAEQLLAELEISHRQLKEYAGQVAELATTKERNRLARDIHDTLGHYLTVINVQLEKALAFRAKRPREAEQAVSDAKRLASEALHDVRRSVGALRTTQDVFTFLPAMQALVQRVNGERCAVVLRVEGSEEGFSKLCLMVLYRVAQEGLTNVQKHAGASRALVELCFREDEVSLLVSDDGRGFDSTRMQQERVDGYGLQGVQERLELVAGSLCIESAPGEGTRLSVIVPREHILYKIS